MSACTRLVPIPLLAVLVVLSICELAGSCSKPAPATHHIAIEGMQFVPADLVATVGDTIVWTNEDVLPHTATTVTTAIAAFDSHEIAAKAQWSLTLTEAGAYPYVCTYHPSMRGLLTVR